MTVITKSLDINISEETAVYGDVLFSLCVCIGRRKKTSKENIYKPKKVICSADIQIIPFQVPVINIYNYPSNLSRASTDP